METQTSWVAQHIACSVGLDFNFNMTVSRKLKRQVIKNVHYFKADTQQHIHYYQVHSSVGNLLTKLHKRLGNTA